MGSVPEEGELPPKARLVRWPNRLLIVVIVLWAVPGALFVSPWSIGSGLLILALVTWLIVAWLALPVVMLISGAIWITRLRRATPRRWVWVAAWVAVVVVGVPMPFWLPALIGPIGRSQSFDGIAGSLSTNTGHLYAQSVTFLIFGAAMIALLTWAARSAARADLPVGRV